MHSPFNKKKDIIRDSHVEGVGLDFGSGLGTATRVIVKDENGKILFSGHNTTVLPGRIALLEEMFGIERNAQQHLTLNTILGIPHSETSTVLNDSTKKRQTLWFMAGNGAASKEVQGKYYSPKNYATKLYNPIPLRMVPEGQDLSSTERENYRLRKIIEVNGVNYIAYSAKKFDPGSVILEYNKAEYLPVESDTVPVDENDSSHRLSGGSVLAYIDFVLTIETEELKEYFTIKNGSLDGAGMSEVGMIYASDLPNALDDNRYELAAAELFAKVTTENISFQRSSVSRLSSYKIYAK